MTCEEFLRLLDDEQPPTSGEAAAHLASCPACRRAWERAQAMRRELRAMREDSPPPPFLHSRVMANVRAERAARRPWWNMVARPAWAGAALVALLLVMVSGYRLYELFRPTPLATPAHTVTTMDKVAKTLPQFELRADETERREAAAPAPPPARRPSPAASGERRKSVAEPPMSPAFAPAPPVKVAARPAEPAPTREREALAPGEQPAAEAAPRGAAIGRAGTTYSASTANGPLATESSASPPRQLAGAASSVSYAVVCVLRAGDVVVGRPLLPGSATPPADTSWQVEVHRDGSVTVRDTTGREITPAKTPLATVAASLHLSPGRYTLVRFRP
ncbi:MAG: hypothetical protein ACHQQS_01265 [Thermoanaerobaculales bacterium]